MRWSVSRLVLLLVLTSLPGSLAMEAEEDLDLYSDEKVEPTSENICDVTVPVSIYCYCDSLTADDATAASCWIFNVTLENDAIWDMFGTQPHLTELKINLRPAGRLTFIPSRALRLLPKLSLIHIFYAEIGTIFPDSFPAMLTELQELNLANNQIARLSENAFKNLASLRSLSLAENQIQSLQRSSFSGLLNLQMLRLAMNNISLVHDGVFVDLQKLQELDLSSNNVAVLTAETFIGLESLQTLLLQNNILEILGDNTFKYAPLIKHLDLKSNRLQVIREAALADLKHLEYLNLQDNQIRHLADSTFHGLGRLNYLNLRNNQLESINETTCKPLWKNLLASAMTFQLEGNPFHCSCELQWLKDVYMATKSVKLHESLNRSTCQTQRKISKPLLQSIHCQERTTTTTPATTTTTTPTTTTTAATTTTPSSREISTRAALVAAPRTAVTVAVAASSRKHVELNVGSDDDLLQKDTLAQPEPTAITEKQPVPSSQAAKGAVSSLVVPILALWLYAVQLR